MSDMKYKIVFGIDTPLITKAMVASRIGVSVDAIEAAAIRLSISFVRTASGHWLTSLRQAQIISEHFQQRLAVSNGPLRRKWGETKKEQAKRASFSSLGKADTTEEEAWNSIGVRHE